MCNYKMPDMDTAVAGPPPVPEESAATKQGAPETTKRSIPFKNRNKLRIDRASQPDNSTTFY